MIEWGEGDDNLSSDRSCSTLYFYYFYFYYYYYYYYYYFYYFVRELDDDQLSTEKERKDIAAISPPA